MDRDRILNLDGRRNFSGHNVTEGDHMLDLRSCTFKQMDYKTGTHGFLDVALAYPD